MSEPNGPGPSKPDGHKLQNNEQEVTDPITHLPLTIHDADTVELERIPPPPTAAEAKQIREDRGADSKEETNERHSDMERVVEEAVHGKWWEDPIGDQRRTMIQTSAVAAVAASLGAFGMLILWTLFSRILGGKQSGSGLGWIGFLLSPFVCCFLGLGVGAAGLALGVYQRPPDLPVEKERQNLSHDQRVSIRCWLLLIF